MIILKKNIVESLDRAIRSSFDHALEYGRIQCEHPSCLRESIECYSYTMSSAKFYHYFPATVSLILEKLTASCKELLLGSQETFG